MSPPTCLKCMGGSFKSNPRVISDCRCEIFCQWSPVPCRAQVFVVHTDLCVCLGENTHTHTEFMQGRFLVLNIHSSGLWGSMENRCPVPADRWVQVSDALLPGLVSASGSPASPSPTEKQTPPTHRNVTTHLPGSSQVPATVY